MMEILILSSVVPAAVISIEQTNNIVDVADDDNAW